MLSAGGLRSFIASASNAAAANEAVHVKVTKSVPGSLVANLGGLFGGGGNANVDLRAEAVARRLPNATISAGTGLASVNSGQSALLNPILSGLLGTRSISPRRPTTVSPTRSSVCWTFSARMEWA